MTVLAYIAAGYLLLAIPVATLVGRRLRRAAELTFESPGAELGYVGSRHDEIAETLREALRADTVRVLGERASARRRQTGLLAEHDPKSKDSAVPATGTSAESMTQGG